VLGGRRARLARLRGDTRRAEAWFAAADVIHEDICDHAVDQRGVFVQSYGSTELDASVLVLGLVDFLPPDDPRLRATVFAIASELAHGAYVYRYQTASADDGLAGEPEASFTVCSYWLVSALVVIGELDLARSHYERLVASASKLGLYAEENDPLTGRQLGNFPQALTHLAMVNATLQLIRADSGDNRLHARAAGALSWWDAAGKEGRTMATPLEEIASALISLRKEGDGTPA
jgi:GH15 family glucan-1,4-alpha-glucosidase